MEDADAEGAGPVAVREGPSCTTTTNLLASVKEQVRHISTTSFSRWFQTVQILKLMFVRLFVVDLWGRCSSCWGCLDLQLGFCGLDQSSLHRGSSFLWGRLKSLWRCSVSLCGDLAFVFHFNLLFLWYFYMYLWSISLSMSFSVPFERYFPPFVVSLSLNEV